MIYDESHEGRIESNRAAEAPRPRRCRESHEGRIERGSGKTTWTLSLIARISRREN